MEGTTDAEEPSSSAASAMPESEIAKDEMGRGDGAGRQLEKPRVVRIKRKREQAPIETLWLEVNDPPSKRHEPDISKLTLLSTSESRPSAKEDAPTKLLFRRVETISPSSKKTTSLYESLLQKVNERKPTWEKRKDQRDSQSKSKEKQEHLLAGAKEQHEALAKTARFEQVWKSRRIGEKASLGDGDNDSMHELFHLYDVVRVDVEAEAEAAEKATRQEQAKREAEVAERTLLSNFLPLLRECLPEVAIDVEESIASLRVSNEPEDYVYDVYAMEEGSNEQEETEAEFYPTVQIVEDEGYDWREPNDSDYDSDDSNDENNPLNDYPDEDDFGEGFQDKNNDSDGSGDFDPYATDHEEYDTVAYDEEDNLRWRRRL